MAHRRDRGKKEKRKPPKHEKKRKGLPPHLEQRTTTPHQSVQEIQRHLDELARKKG